MFFANNVSEIDFKADDYCAPCKLKLGWQI
jgi:predicted Zn-dependent protease